MAFKPREGYDTPEYETWRNAVFLRDKYTCQYSGSVGGELEAHHIRPWADNPSLRYLVSNGITLSKRVHQDLVTGNEAKFQDHFEKIIRRKLDDEKSQAVKRTMKVNPEKSQPKPRGPWKPRSPYLRY